MLGAPFAGVGGVDDDHTDCVLGGHADEPRPELGGGHAGDDLPEPAAVSVFFTALAVGEVQVLDRTHLTQHRLVLIGEPFEPSPNTHPRRRVRDKRGSHPTQDGHDGGLRQDPDPNPGRNSSMTDIIHPSTDNNHRADVTPRSFTRTAATGNTPSRNQPVPGLPINALNTRPPRQIHTTEHTHYNVRTLTITQYSANCSEPLLQE
jgi:hypothetical protein